MNYSKLYRIHADLHMPTSIAICRGIDWSRVDRASAEVESALADLDALISTARRSEIAEYEAEVRQAVEQQLEEGEVEL